MTKVLPLMDASWPPAEVRPCGTFMLRRGLGGGQRVSAASCQGPWTSADLDRAEAGMRDMDQPPLFMLTPGDGALDQALATRGYALKDPVALYTAPCADLVADGPAWMTTFPHWPPLAIAADIWQEGDIGPERRAIMQRAAGPKTAILSRSSDRASGIAFVALSGPVAFVHALHVAPHLRRQGTARAIIRAAAAFATQSGAASLAVAVTVANHGANALYASLGMAVVGQYHYRHLPALRLT